jgi:hypothetical protein
MTRDPTGTDHRATCCRARHAPPLGSQTINAVVTAHHILPWLAAMIAAACNHSIAIISP